MPIGSTIKRITVCTLILCVLTGLMCLGCKSQEDLALPVVVEVPTQTPIPFPTLVPLTSTIPIELKEENLSTAEVVKLLKPSVVHIATGSVSMDMLGQEIPRTGLGSGLVLDMEGRILTNNHVVDNAQVITATLGDGRSYPASLLGADPVTDLAVIQINAAQLEPARLGNSSKIEVGEDVIAVGHALGLKGGPTVSKGVVSAVNRTIPRSVYTSMIGLIQTDASINPGNSGGPVLNMNAQVVGIASAGLSKLYMAKEANYIPENVNFAVASQTLTAFLKAHKVKITSGPSKIYSTKELAKIGEPATIQLFCMNTMAEYEKLKKAKTHADVLLDLN